MPLRLVECCVHAPSPDFPGLDWVFCVIDEEKEFKVVRDRRLAYNPYVVFRWNTIENESMGRGPILDAMGDIGPLNTMQKVFNEWGQRFALGALLIPAKYPLTVQPPIAAFAPNDVPLSEISQVFFSASGFGHGYRNGDNLACCTLAKFVSQRRGNHFHHIA
jgi:hypothetical protein